MEYKKELYKKYISLLNKHFGVSNSQDDFFKQFSTWRGYYGSFLPVDRGAPLLDVACGDGGLLFWLQNIGYSCVEGVDISEEQISLAHSLGVSSVVCDDIFDFLKCSQKKYDCIFAIDILEHFSKDQAISFLQLLYKHLSPGGSLIMKTPNGDSLTASHLRYADFTHEVIFTESSLREVLGLVGFSSFLFKETTPVIHGSMSFFRYVLWKIIRFFVCAYYMIETGNSPHVLTQNIIVSTKK